MSNITDEIVFLALQFFTEEDLRETAHVLGRESGLYFDLKYFEDMILEGMWDDAEKYLSGFTRVDENSHSVKIYFELRKQKYLEALDRKDRQKAVDILMNELKVFVTVNEEIFKSLTNLLTADNIREIKSLYQDTISERKKIAFDVKRVIENHPGLSKKLNIPPRRLKLQQLLLNQSWNWMQHQNPGVPSPHVVSPNALLMSNICHSRPSTSAPPNPEMALQVNGTPNEIFTERPLVLSDKGDRKRVLVEVTPDDSTVESHKSSKNVIEISEPSQFRFFMLPKHSEVNKIVKLSYDNAGNTILALESNGTHQLWGAKEPTEACPEMWYLRNGMKVIANDLTNTNSGDSVSAFAITKKDAYFVSTSGGKVSLFNMVTFKTLGNFLPPPPMVTSLAFDPQDNNTLVVGLDDSSILIYHIPTFEVQLKLKGHSKRVTALTFSTTLNVLVSADASAKIAIWNVNKWEKLRARNLQIEGLNSSEGLSDTIVQFHPEQKNFLVVHNTLLAIYEATELKCVNQWNPTVSVVINQATFSCDGHMVYASFVDGTLGIFDSSDFQMYYRIHPSAYLSSTPSVDIQPTAIAAHPKKPNQFAAGLTDGSVYVFEPQEENWNVGHVSS